MVESPLEYIISLLAPHECRICKREGCMLCFACADTEVFEPESRCHLCNKLTKQNRIRSNCRSRSRLRRGWWLGQYETLVKELLRETKYHSIRPYAHEFGLHLGRHVPYLPAETLVVAVPTASSRVRQRGYDQVVLIARQFATARGLP